MDVLSDILDALRLRGTLYFSTEFGSWWGVRVPAFRRVARFHLVARGHCWVRVEGKEGDAERAEREGPSVRPPEAIRLESGDLVLIPHGAEHVLMDAPGRACRTVDEVVEEAGFTGSGALVYGGDDDGGPTRLVCGHFEFDEGLEHPLLSQLPPAIVVRWDEEVRGSPLEDVFRFMVREVQQGRPGYEAVVRRLSEVLFVQAVRFWADHSEHEQGVLAALADPRLGDALSAIHRDPAERWTLESLGRQAAMSRTAFAERFREVVGETPLQYLTSWRMQNAKRLLAESRMTLARIAGRVGYESAASFSRAFKRTVGETPGGYRRLAQQDGS